MTACASVIIDSRCAVRQPGLASTAVVLLCLISAPLRISPGIVGLHLIAPIAMCTVVGTWHKLRLACPLQGAQQSFFRSRVFQPKDCP